jgi:predicted ArsR family transcriptional regulator
VDTRELLAPDASAPLGRSRARVLDLLRDSGSAVTANEVADRCVMHPNTARFHLDALVEAGLAVRDNGTAQGGPGRPAVGYRSADGGEPTGASGERRFRLLAQMLASLVAGLVNDPAETAERAGREWGAFLTEPAPPYRRQSAAAAIAELTGLLASMGFEPQVEADATAGGAQTPWQPAGRPRILLRECPFREVAREHQAVVCSLHLGVVRGALDQMHAPLTADRLEVFPEPGVCRMHLTISGKHEGREHAQ